MRFSQMVEAFSTADPEQPVDRRSWRTGGNCGVWPLVVGSPQTVADELQSRS